MAPGRAFSTGEIISCARAAEIAFLEKALVFKERDVTPDNKAVSPMTGVTAPGVADDVAADVTDDIAPVTAALAEAVKTLRDQLEIANGRADRAERRIEELRVALVEERRKLIAILTDQRHRPWWRRWFRS
jgi:Mg2+ and Co2+ transporter CorA